MLEDAYNLPNVQSLLNVLEAIDKDVGTLLSYLEERLRYSTLT